MAVVMDQNQQQQQPYKHYCRICKKGFGCGRALGGHMRAHGITDEPTNHADTDDDSPPACNDWDDDNTKPNTYKRMYALRANLNRRVCENCGKEFVSWKSFLAHGRCSSDDDSEGDSMGSNGEEDLVGCAAWSKGKRSRRCRTSEEEDLANCLVMLSAARVEPILVAEAEESCASASREEDVNRGLIPVSLGDKCKAPAAPAVPTGVFECKACKKVFNSHQALGGHRASHKKVKGCFAAKLEDLEEATARDEEVVITATITNENSNFGNDAMAMAMSVVPLDQHEPLRKKSKVHECSICHRVFASGQALGGHKRCHWITSNAGDSKPHATVPASSQLQLSPMFDSSKPLDLNVPASADETIGSPLRLEVPAAAYVQAMVDQRNNNINESSNHLTVDHDESYSKVKLAKLSELKDINMGGESAPWLQVGIGSSTNEK
ncbi:zinc finger protein ZAT4-like [Dioscorea cayenensis subsp. rotundata]|uniref:Zinc finger protein ZAT4-like n=1 Tax=Dioscorea cayennensis subsp. rotundata TaxID=55577 RepID=A0AB40B284_DIOCR|nr:zinc finger protein ZAT4-like [Dioscorea cayenensis subsp. rotundata]